MRVHLHSLLAEKGGAARVARSLERGLKGRGFEVGRGYEIGESGARSDLCRPGDLGRLAPEDSLVNLHGSEDFDSCLAGLAGHKGRIVITMHDCRLFTAGCPFPLDCESWRGDCLDCQRGYGPGARNISKVKESLIDLGALVAAPSRWMAGMAASALPGVEVRVIPNGVAWPDTAAGKRAAKREAGLDPDARCVMFAAHGGISAEYKGGDTWLDIWRAVKARLPGVVGIVAGGDRTGREGDLVFWPYLEEQALRGLLRAADVLAYPTRADNHPLLVLEAMSEATASLAFAAGGIPEQIEDGDTGFLVPEGDWRLFGQRLVGLLGNPFELRNAGLRAFEGGRSRFSEERMVDGYAGLFRRLTGEDSLDAAS